MAIKRLSRHQHLCCLDVTMGKRTRASTLIFPNRPHAKPFIIHNYTRLCDSGAAVKLACSRNLHQLCYLSVLYSLRSKRARTIVEICFSI